MKATQTFSLTLLFFLLAAKSIVAQENSKNFFFSGLEVRNGITRNNDPVFSTFDYPFQLETSDYHYQTPGLMLGYLGGFKWLVYKVHLSYWAGSKTARQYNSYNTTSPSYEVEAPRPYDPGQIYYSVNKGFSGKLTLQNIDVEGSVGVKLNKIFSLTLGLRRTQEIANNFRGVYEESFTKLQQNLKGQNPTYISSESSTYSIKQLKDATPRKPVANNYLSFGIMANCKFGKRDALLQLDYNAPIFQRKIINEAYVNLKVGVSIWSIAKPNVIAE